MSAKPDEIIRSEAEAVPVSISRFALNPDDCSLTCRSTKGAISSLLDCREKRRDGLVDDCSIHLRFLLISDVIRGDLSYDTLRSY